MKKISLTIVICILFVFHAIAQTWEVVSPEGNNVVKIELKQKKLYYSISRKGKTVISASRLGIRLKECDLRKFSSVNEAGRNKNDSKWKMEWGEKAEVRDYYNELKLTAKNGKKTLDITFRVFEDGVGFRYSFPEQGYNKLNIIDEITDFNMTPHAAAWWIHADYDSYELLYNETLLSEVDTAHTPITIKLDNGIHLSIHEASLVDYASMTLKNNDNGLTCDLVPWRDGIKVKKEKEFETPWRVVIISDDAAGLVTSDMILNLNEPNKLGDVSWVEPMRYMGIWWDMHLGTKSWNVGDKHGATTAYAKEMIDFASKNNFRGLLVEGWNLGWEKWQNWSFTQAYPDFDIEAVQAYANEKGMTLIGHHETGGHVTKEYEPNLEEAFAFYGKLGIKAVKTGYVGKIDNKEYHHGQFMVNHYQRVVDIAAKHKVCIVAHEPIKATGLRRTYPNFLAREGLRGQEYNAWADPSNPPNHTTTIVYTRMLSGPIDFTPGAFQMTYEAYKDVNSRIPTTLAKQLALYITIYSPVQMACDLPKHYEQYPEMFEFIKTVPVDWADTKVLNGEVGKYITIVRKDKKGSDWYLGSMTDEEPRTLEIDLDFLEEGKKYSMTIFQDGENAEWKNKPYDFNIQHRFVQKGEKLTIKLASGGGTAIRFVAR